MKVYKKSNKEKKIRARKSGNAKEAIGEIEKGMDLFIMSFGQFSLIDAVLAVLDQIGPAHVKIGTWTINYPNIDHINERLEDGRILSFRMIIDRSFQTRKPDDYVYMDQVFGESVRMIPIHSKFIVIQNENYGVVIQTSMNLNENPRIENLEISENSGFADFFETMFDDIFDEVGYGENRASLPGLNNVVDNQYQLCFGNHIKRSDLNECHVSHSMGIRPA